MELELELGSNIYDVWREEEKHRLFSVWKFIWTQLLCCVKVECLVD